MSKVIIIAEAGVNHNGDFELAKELVKAAAAAGADFVKFQTFKASKLVTKSAQQADYQKKNIKDSDNSQFKMLKKLEMPESWHYQLKEYAYELGIGFLSTGFDEESIDFLDQLQISLFKIPSGEITNKPYLVHIASKKKPVIISTGMADITDIRAAINVLLDEGVSLKNITVLHCNTEYPTPMVDVNLLAMNAIASELGVAIGYSDHTLGIEVPIAAVALGAKVIEKHFTLDRTMNGPDHVASLEPKELYDMVRAIRNIELAIQGSGIKEPSESEYKNIVIARKSIHIKVPLKAGHTIKSEDLEMKRPGDGISPMKIDEVIGRKVRIDLQVEHKLILTDLI
ncbi:N-acetylneuraminate synthase/N,N'-diacetyllegionaminate synthase [Daejeonella rubra]|uniref:N-acetylneuraminate synthase/N,N'-diacetyllegionaminate synthase n=1 Tax=Daejeonella rubra TaxID=990371 RepID=A0A1G9WUM0_9SPHI|nr:N-acetylneuraminate synthase [Daejeonella rubra]SDM87803.1 N-acetylneuraminate synthase/N,N'-diacetyllegionaminate synthase [Daejeonella rubra]